VASNKSAGRAYAASTEARLSDLAARTTAFAAAQAQQYVALQTRIAAAAEAQEAETAAAAATLAQLRAMVATYTKST
jgi:hypothetical protein